jgi:hypothetical protein
MKTNTAASPVKDSHPQEHFSADLSVFQAHLPWHVIDMPSLWFVIGHDQGVKPERIPPARAVNKTVRLTVRLSRATFFRGRPEACVSRRNLWNGWPFPPRRRLQPAAGPFTPVGSWMENHGVVLV